MMNQTRLKADLKQMIEGLSSNENKKDSIDDFSNKLATIIDEYIRTASVSTNVKGTCQTPAGAGTITGTGIGQLQ